MRGTHQKLDESDAKPKGALGLLSRLLPDRIDAFRFEEIPKASGLDVFEIETVDGRIVLRGSSGVAQASALNWYLKYTCHRQVSWNHRRLELPHPLPRTNRIRIESPYRYRYYLNYCTFSYSLAFWDWQRWEEEIDWMALNGINTPLAITGQEAIWQRVYRQMNLSDEEIADYFVGPAYLPFGWMGCIDRWGGPLPQSWIDRHLALQHMILARQREFGMTPVLQGFTGHVPEALIRKFPDCKFHQLVWQDSAPTYLLDPSDALFQEIADRFMAMQIQEFGTDHLYGADTFIEMTLPSRDLNYISKIAQAVYQGMAKADPKAVWVMQGWIFQPERREHYWSDERIQALFDAIPDEGMLLLDLWAEQNPVWRSTRAFGGKPWIWSIVHNFGGNPGVFGRLPQIAQDPPTILSDPTGGNLCGIGLAMEAIENNPVVYELTTEMAWRKEPVDGVDWIKGYAHRRYGMLRPQLEKAWTTLLQAVYSIDVTPTRLLPTSWGSSVICGRPTLEPQAALNHAPQGIVEAWESLIEASDASEALSESAAYRFDLVDVARQALSDLAHELHEEMVAGYEAADLKGFARSSASFLAVIDDLDRLVSTEPLMLLGRWIDAARRWGANEEERDLYEWNARNLITLWGARESSLADYSGRHWGGLLRSYYRPRWERLVQRVQTALKKGETFDAAAFLEEIRGWEERWTRQTVADQAFPTEPEGDPVAVSRVLFEKYRDVLKTGT